MVRSSVVAWTAVAYCAMASGVSAQLGSPAEQALRKPLGIRMTWAVTPGMTARKGSMYDRFENADTVWLPGNGSMELNSGPSVWFVKGNLHERHVMILEAYGRRRDANIGSLADYVNEVDPPGSHKYGPSFDHREVRLAGLRAMESISHSWAERGGQRHLYIEVDPRRHLYVSLLSDQRSNGPGDPIIEEFNAAYVRFIASLKFEVIGTAAGGSPGAADAPPARSGAAAANGAASNAPATSTAGRAAAASGASATGGAGAGDVSSRTGTRAATSTVSAPVASAADANGVLLGRGALQFTGAAVMVVVNNESRASWTQCRITGPGRRTLDVGTIPALAGRDYPVSSFASDPNADTGIDAARLNCREGALELPANLSGANADSLRAALQRTSRDLENQVKKAGDKVKSAFGGLFKKP